MYSFQNIHIHSLDLSDSKSVVEFGRRFVESGTELNVLVSYDNSSL